MLFRFTCAIIGNDVTIPVAAATTTTKSAFTIVFFILIILSHNNLLCTFLFLYTLTVHITPNSLLTC